MKRAIAEHYSIIFSPILLMGAALSHGATSALDQPFSISGQSVYTTNFEICDAAKGAVVQGNEGSQLDFMIYDAGGNLILFDISEASSARVRIDKIEQLECETFTLSVVNQTKKDAQFSFKLLRVRSISNPLRGDSGSSTSPKANRFPRCPSSDPRCTKL